MSVEILIPWRNSSPARSRAWGWVHGRYSEHGWRTREGWLPDGPWSKGLAVARALEQSDAEILVVADADVWCPGLALAVSEVAVGAPWAMPHDYLYRLSEEGTADLLRGKSWQGQLEERPYRGLFGGGIVVLTREVLEAVPLDPRFTGWGQEDESWALALSCLLGDPWRGTAPLLHLWHPEPERLSRRHGSTENWNLACRYRRARRDPTEMEALIDEQRPEPKPEPHTRRSAAA